MLPIILTIEKSENGKEIWGSVSYEGDLLVDHAQNLETLEKKFKKLLYDFHDVDPKKITFEHAWDLTTFFDAHSYLNISAVAEKTGINASLMRQYASGAKKTSTQTASKIERALHGIARDLLSVRIGATINRELKPLKSPAKRS